MIFNFFNVVCVFCDILFEYFVYDFVKSFELGWFVDLKLLFFFKV